jgi:hypothetical protein
MERYLNWICPDLREARFFLQTRVSGGKIHARCRVSCVVPKNSDSQPTCIIATCDWKGFEKEGTSLVMEVIGYIFIQYSTNHNFSYVYSIGKSGKWNIFFVQIECVHKRHGSEIQSGIVKL